MVETLTVLPDSRKKITAKLKRQSKRKLFSYEKMYGIVQNIFNISPSSTKLSNEILPIDGGSAGTVFLEVLKHADINSLPVHAYYGYDQSFLNELTEPFSLEKMAFSK